MEDFTVVREIYQDPEKFADKELALSGWVRFVRDQKNLVFVQMNDGTCLSNVQLVATPQQTVNYDQLPRLGIGASIIARGKLVLTPQAKQPFELQVRELAVVGDSPEDYPLQPKRHGVEFLRTIQHLRPRTNLFAAVNRVQSEASFAIHQFFHDQGFMHVHTPIITASDAEGAGEMFTVTTLLDHQEPPLTAKGEVDFSKDFFRTPAHLTVSGQLYGECFAQAYRKIYVFGPTFRAEHSNTTRHAAEFWQLEPEIAFADLGDAMDLAENMLKYILNYILKNCPAEMSFFDRFVKKGVCDRLQLVVDSDFARMTYTDAVRVLEKVNDKFRYPVSWGVDLQTEHERYLTEEYVGGPLFVTDYPAAVKAFYMKANPDGKTVAASDCLVPGIGEIVGGSQREDDWEKLKNKIINLKMDLDDYSWYLDLRKYGSTPHAGFGLGFERFIMYLTGVGNIRDISPFPRTVGGLGM